MSVLAVIPARYASSRFPGKMLAAETGKPLIQHVWERARLAETVDQVIIATDDSRIREAAEGFGALAVMTSVNHPNGTARIAEAVSIVERVHGLRPRIIVNVQGDEPEIDPTIIDCAVWMIAGEAYSDCQVATICSPFHQRENPSDPNIVKVVSDHRGRALYFSRALIPFNRDGASLPRDCGPFKHVGLYVYRREFLPVYVALAQTPLEHAEKLEQLRVLEHGYRIAVALREAHHHGIDTPEQYRAFVARTVGRV